jgi:hypothetical protein
MSAQTFNIATFQPLVDIPVVITTHWKRYLATLSRSDFGGFEFVISGESHRVQLSTVHSWHFAETNR